MFIRLIKFDKALVIFLFNLYGLNFNYNLYGLNFNYNLYGLNFNYNFVNILMLQHIKL